MISKGKLIKPHTMFIPYHFTKKLKTPVKTDSDFEISLSVLLLGVTYEPTVTSASAGSDSGFIVSRLFQSIILTLLIFCSYV